MSLRPSRALESRQRRPFAQGVYPPTYEEIQDQYPQEAAARRADKFTYRYPRGESYFDILSRLDPLVHEMESYKEPLLIVSHQAVLRCLYAT